MSKLISKFHEMEIEDFFIESRVAGLVTRSNFLTENERHAFPIINPDILNKIDRGDKIRVTIFTNDTDVTVEEDNVRFIKRGIRYEKWDTESEGWEKIFEEFS